MDNSITYPKRLGLGAKILSRKDEKLLKDPGSQSPALKKLQRKLKYGKSVPGSTTNISQYISPFDIGTTMGDTVVSKGNTDGNDAEETDGKLGKITSRTTKDQRSRHFDVISMYISKRKKKVNKNK